MIRHPANGSQDEAALQAQLLADRGSLFRLEAVFLHINGIFHHPYPVPGNLGSEEPVRRQAGTGPEIRGQFRRKGLLHFLMAAQQLRALHFVRFVYERGVGVDDHFPDSRLPRQLFQQKPRPEAVVQVQNLVSALKYFPDSTNKQVFVLPRRRFQEMNPIRKIPVLLRAFQRGILRQKIEAEPLPVHVLIIIEYKRLNSAKTRRYQLKDFHRVHPPHLGSLKDGSSPGPKSGRKPQSFYGKRGPRPSGPGNPHPGFQFHASAIKWTLPGRSLPCFPIREPASSRPGRNR